MPKKTQATVPEPYENLSNLRNVCMALKELTEVLSGQRGDPEDHAVTWGDLVRVGLVKKDQVPK